MASRSDFLLLSSGDQLLHLEGLFVSERQPLVLCPISVDNLGNSILASIVVKKGKHACHERMLTSSSLIKPVFPLSAPIMSWSL